jgi:hypothetical protein
MSLVGCRALTLTSGLLLRPPQCVLQPSEQPVVASFKRGHAPGQLRVARGSPRRSRLPPCRCASGPLTI